MVTEIPRQTLNDLYDAASRFQQLGAWQWMTDEDVFGVVHPQTGTKAYCSIMGNLGEFFGFAVYIGPEGFRCLKEMNDESEESNLAQEEFVYRQDCLICSFEDEDEVEPDDAELIRNLGLRFRGPKSTPGFKSYRPGFMPWAINAEEANWLLLVLEQAIIVAAQYREDPGIIGKLGIVDKQKMPFRIQDAQGAWTYAALDTDSPIDLSPPQLSIPATDVNALKKLPKSDNIWLFEQFFLDLPSMDPSENRPFFPKAIVVLDVEDGTFASVEAMKPEEVAEQAGEVIVGAFRTHGFVPAQIVVANRENYILLKSFCKTLAVDLYLDKEMGMIPELREAVMEIMGDEDEDEVE